MLNFKFSICSLAHLKYITESHFENILHLFSPQNDPRNIAIEEKRQGTDKTVDL